MAMKHLMTTLAFAGGLACSNAVAWDQDPFAQYFQRSDTVTLGAGNAKAANTATHMINPWPPYVMDRRIPGEGQRLVGAVERYRDVGRISRTPCPITPQFDIQTAGVRSTTTQCGTGGGVVGS